MDATDIDLDLDCNFEPQTRARSNTWPLRPTGDVVDAHNSPVSSEDAVEQHGIKDPLGLNAKKSGSRRNAWGNLSYADLITKAIQSSPEHRLTLSQIYDWMVQNVPFFKDKGDSTSSAGWKNSIRHNLSLHNRFMRIQNEGTGKSSWWVINPDAKPGKTPRRRAGSMETKSYEKKRGRVRKKVEALRASLENGGTLSPGVSEDYLDAFSDFRSRASSNASSCGRLSPIHAIPEPDLHDNQVPPMSPSLWSTDINQSPTMYSGDCYSDLVDSLGERMKLSPDDMNVMSSNIRDPYISGSTVPDYVSQQHTQSFLLDRPSNGIDSPFSRLPAPPPYPKSQQPQVTTSLDFQQKYHGLRLQLRMGPGKNIGNATNVGGFQPSSELYEPLQEFNDSVGIKQEVNSEPSPLSSPNTLSINTQQHQQHSSSDLSQHGSPNTASYPHLSPQSVLVNGHQQSSGPTLKCQLSPQQSSHLTHQSPLLSQQSSHLTQQSPLLPQQSLSSFKTSIQTTQQQQQQHILQQQANQASILREALTKGSVSFRPNTYVPNNFSPVAVVCPIATNTHSSNMAGMAMPNSDQGLHHSLTTGQQIRSLSDNHFLGQQQIIQTGCNADFGNINVNNNVSSALSNSSVPSDIDLDLISGLDYDMDSVIKQELAMEGNLDFNFESSAPPSSVGQNVVH